MFIVLLHDLVVDVLELVEFDDFLGGFDYLVVVLLQELRGVKAVNDNGDVFLEEMVRPHDFFDYVGVSAHVGEFAPEPVLSVLLQQLERFPHKADVVVRHAQARQAIF